MEEQALMATLQAFPSLDCIEISVTDWREKYKWNLKHKLIMKNGSSIDQQDRLFTEKTGNRM